MRFRTVAAAMFAVGLVGAAVASHQLSASAEVPQPVVCAPYVTETPTTLGGTLRVTVRTCSPISEPHKVVSVCRTETLVRQDGVEAKVSDTCAS